MELNIVCIPGDGIGPEIVAEAKKVLDVVGDRFGHTIKYTDILMGGASIDVHGSPLTDEAIETAKSADAVLMGSIGGNTSQSLVQTAAAASAGGRAFEAQKVLKSFCKFKTGCFI